MPLFSAFTPFGLLEFTSDSSDAEKIYNSMISSIKDPETGTPTLDICEESYEEAKLYATSIAIACAGATVKQAGRELRGETAYYQLEAQEDRYKVSPAATDDIPTRRRFLADKQKAARGSRFEAVWEGLTNIFGDDLVAYRPIAISEAEAYPATLEDSPGIFRRPDTVAKSVRLLTAVTRLATPWKLADSWVESNADSTEPLDDNTGNTGIAEPIVGDGCYAARAIFHLAKTGSPTGTAVAKIYAPDDPDAPTIPSGSALATSEPFDVSALTGSAALTTFDFVGNQRILLESGVTYFLALEYSSGNNGVDSVDVSTDATFAGHDGTAALFAGGVWAPHGFGSTDVVFYLYTGSAMEVAYENWNGSLVESTVLAGDILCVDPGNWGLVEKVKVLSARGSGTERKFTALFDRPHSAGAYATDGPVPLWSNSKRHVLVVVSASASVDPIAVARLNELFTRIMRAPTTWAVVRETTPGSGTVGPFKVGSTTGSPLGTTPVESITL